MSWFRKLIDRWFSRSQIQIAMGAVGLTAAEADRLEAALTREPSDIHSRLELLGYLMSHQFTSPDHERRKAEHALWFIKNEPASEITGSPFCHVLAEDPAYPRVAEAWERVVSEPKVLPKALLNASHFFSLPDPAKSEVLLQRGQAAEPQSSEWDEELGQNLFREVTVARMGEDQGRPIDLKPEALRELASRALSHFERALRLASTPQKRFNVLVRCAQAAREAGKPDDAFRYANETLDLAPQCGGERHRPDILHWAHMVRGQVFLDSGDVTAAERELDLAGKQGKELAPVLRSFGPEFRLARRLLEVGRKDAVLSYLRCCATFWNRKRVRKWIAAIDKGDKPRMFTGFDPEEMPGRGPTA